VTRAAAIAAVLSLVLAGCAGVKAHQRGKLAKAKMQFNPNPEQNAAEQHVYSYREGSTGGYDAGGGGCGCN
jgi:hypothetical protein